VARLRGGTVLIGILADMKSCSVNETSSPSLGPIQGAERFFPWVDQSEHEAPPSAEVKLSGAKFPLSLVYFMP